MDLLMLFLYGVASYIVAVILGPLVIEYFKKQSVKQVVREEGLESHQVKTGTPTMGGVIFMVPGLLVALVGGFVAGFAKADLMVILGVTLGFGLVGFIDDYKKVIRKHNDGLSAKMKILGQTLVALPLTLYIVSQSTAVWIPFTDYFLDMGILKYAFVYIAIIATSNAVNITDGADGLASSVTILVLAFYVYLGHALDMVPVALASTTMIGGLLGFLMFNKYPAKIFMGDVGSLALGGLVVALAGLTQTLFLIFIVGIIYFIETLSVTLQVLYFKKTGKRIFKMSPLHHHFELCGWHENKILRVFSVVTLVGIVLGVISLIGRLS